MPKRKTLTEVKLEIEASGEYVLLSDEYVNNMSKLLVKHNTCGEVFETNYQRFAAGCRCPNCYGNKKKGIESVKEEIESVPNYKLLTTEYINNRQKLDILHESCGNVYKSDIKNFHRGCRCPYCFGTKKKTAESFNDEVKQIDKDYEVLSYNGALSKSLFKHLACGNTYEARPNDFLSGSRCPYCFKIEKHSIDDFKDYIKSNNLDYTVLSDGYTNSKDINIKIRHNSCGHEYLTSYSRFVINGLRCPKCARKFNVSREEDSLVSYIKSLGFNIIENYRPDGFNTYELDIFIKELNIGIEFDGAYWHSTKFKDPKYHVDKMKFYNSKGIRVINVFEDEWMDKQELVKRKLSHILGKDTSNKVYGRKCIVKKIDVTDDKDEFLLRNHIQGTDKSTYKYGLYYDSELVAVMTFGVPRAALGKAKHEVGEFELVRYATSCNVIGGFGKLLKFAINDLHMKKILTYADLRYSNLGNNIYEKNGFRLSHISSPNYFYIKNGRRYHRFNFNKTRLKELYPEQYSDSKTEFQITEEAGLYRIYDCGNAVYVLEI